MDFYEFNTTINKKCVSVSNQHVSHAIVQGLRPQSPARPVKGPWISIHPAEVPAFWEVLRSVSAVLSVKDHTVSAIVFAGVLDTYYFC